ncbi:MAG: dihydroneopterin aldolase [Candidatus Lariskella arthropodorum]
MPNLKDYISSIEISDFSIAINIGVSDSERLVPQEVLVDYTVHFQGVPHGCISDNMSDSICYAEILNCIKNFSENRSFMLIEHYSFALFECLRQDCSIKEATLVVKKKPQVPGLKGYASFRISNFSMSI